MPTRCFENEPVFAVVTAPRGQALFMRGYDAGGANETGQLLQGAAGCRRGSAIECACACSPAMSASPGCHEQWNAAGGAPQSGPSIGLAAIRYHAMSGLPCRTDLPTCGAISQFDASSGVAAGCRKRKKTAFVNCTPKVGHPSNVWGVFHGGV